MEPSSWNPNLTSVLEKIRLNSIYLSERHRSRYLELSSLSKYFDLPVIVCSVFSSSFISLNTVPPAKTQLITTLISMGIAILTSVKIYLNLAALITQEVALSKDFYSLSIEIFKCLNLQESDRNVDGVVFMNECYSTYKTLVEQSSLMKINLRKDELIKISLNHYVGDGSSVSSDESKTENILIREEREL